MFKFGMGELIVILLIVLPEVAVAVPVIDASGVDSTVCPELSITTEGFDGFNGPI